MQLRWATALSSKDYVSRKAWREARLPHCPWHPEGGCRFRRHTPYERKSPPGAKVARFYCSTAGRTVSLLPDCLAARFPGALVDIEEVVAVREAGTLQGAAERFRPSDACDEEAPDLMAAMRWVRRRVTPVHATLGVLIGLMPDRFCGCEPRISSFRSVLGTDSVLVALRGIAGEHLHHLPPPLGFGPRHTPWKNGTSCFQHDMGPDPPDGPR